ncbi:MAG: hypothetical protein [Enterobacter phage ENC7]|nr:MAG: hypothetical protein [Enterobacter phage ENC7]UIW11765.1 MAG: hypothetical protein [Enterobacter phage ENC25]UIW12023.1 MAG: hypothetical protein [Enterobacter phage ENC22]
MNMNKNIAAVVGCEVANAERYDNGFSFCVATELEAYKAAYKYRTMPMVNVTYAPNIEMWLVQVYNKI